MRIGVPIIKWLPEYQRSWFGSDLIAGASIWAVLVPLGLAYAEIVGVYPVVGLYTIPLALLGYAVFGGTRLLAVGPDAAVAVLTAGIVASVAVGVDDYLALTVALALIVGVFYVLFSFLKMGWIADLLPDPVLKGFVEGVVWVTILKKSDVLLGLQLDMGSQGFFRSSVQLIKALPDVHVSTMLVGLSGVMALILLRRFAPRLPAPLIVLAGSIILVGIFSLDAAGVAVLGESSASFSSMGPPAGLELSQIIALIPGALAIVVLGFTKSLGPLKLTAEHSGEPIDPDRELLAIGAANIGAGLSGGFAVAGSLTATAVSIDSGGRSQIANVCAGILCVLTIVFLLPLLGNLAFSSLAAIILVALAGLSDIGYFRRLWRINRVEFLIGAAAFLGVLVFDVVAGVMIGVILALFNLAHHIHNPATAVVGRTPSGAFVDIDEHADAREIPGMLIWRQYAPLVFLNARTLSDELLTLALGQKDLRVVVLDATASEGIDSSAANALIRARNVLRAEGIDVWVANPRQAGWAMVVAVLEAAEAEIPPAFDSLADAVARFEQGDTTDAGADD